MTSQDHDRAALGLWLDVLNETLASMAELPEPILRERFKDLRNTAIRLGDITWRSLPASTDIEGAPV